MFAIRLNSFRRSLPRTPLAAAGLVVSLAALLVAGVIGLAEAAGAPAAEPVIARWLTPYFREGKYRWLDIADQPYSSTFRKLFKYSNRQVLAKYTETDGETLRGELVAHGLKPNFAYQVKLEGLPTKPSPFSEDDLKDPRNWTNKRLGEVGRWWCVDCGYNVSSWGMEGDYHKGHRLLGYLLLDFFVTDEHGSARCQFKADSSYHVLWKTSQYPPSVDDAPPRTFEARARKAYGYDDDAPAKEVSIYLEQEYDRPRTGQVKLAEGEYLCRLLITEESFHAYSWSTEENPGGHWCHCLTDQELRFTIRR